MSIQLKSSDSAKKPFDKTLLEVDFLNASSSMFRLWFQSDLNLHSNLLFLFSTKQAEHLMQRNRKRAGRKVSSGSRCKASGTKRSAPEVGCREACAPEAAAGLRVTETALLAREGSWTRSDVWARLEPGRV